MSELLLHNVQKGLSRLLSTPRDLPEIWSRPAIHPTFAAASPAHRRLFTDYVTELERVVPLAMKWWEARLAKLDAREKLPRRTALDRLYRETPAGPASHPDIVTAVRRYFLACEALNRRLPASEWVAPEAFAIGWLNDERYEGLLEVVSGMLYWPLGLDSDGNWL